jgi:hypothetical protein
MRQDLLIVNKPTQAPAGRGVTVGKRHEKVHHLETISISRCRHRIFAIGGALYEQRTDDTGTQTYQPIKSYTLRRRRSTYTDWYRSATLECARCGGFKNKTFSLLQTPQDTHAKFLRSEYLRQIAPTDSDFPRIYGFRPNSESANNGTEQAWHLRRIPGYGWDNQALACSSTRPRSTPKRGKSTSDAPRITACPETPKIPWTAPPKPAKAQTPAPPTAFGP